MFPRRFPAASDNMWTFWNPQAMGLQGQFCGSDLMNQQSQAQLQAQTQAQLVALREQNNILNQQLGVQAQTHIQHLQQLLPLHQSTFHPHQSQPPAPVPDPPTPVAPQSSPPAPSASFNAEEMIQQMKNTVESSMQAFVDKTQERNMNQQHPAPAPPPVQTAPPIPSYPSPPLEVPPPPQHSQRRSRSRSHRHHGTPDKRPVSVPRSPRRATPLRRTYRSSRPRSTHSRRQSISRNPSRRPSRASSVHLRSASPRRREVRQDHEDDFYPEVPSREPASLHPASWEYQHYPQDPSTHTEYHQNEYTHHMNNRPPTSGNPGTNGRTLLSPNLVPMPQGGLTTPSTLTNINVTMIPPQSRPIVPLLHSPPTVHAKIHTDPARSNHVSPPVPSLLDMSPSISKMVPKKNGLVMWCML